MLKNTELSITKNYAQVLFNLLSKASVVEYLPNEVKTLFALISKNSNLFIVKKTDLLNIIKSSKIDSSIQNFLISIILNNRSNLLNAILDQYNVLVNMYNGIKYATVISACNITEEQKKRILCLLEQYFQSKIYLTVKHDSSLLVGIRIQCEGTEIIADLNTIAEQIKNYSILVQKQMNKLLYNSLKQIEC